MFLMQRELSDGARQCEMHDEVVSELRW